MTAAIEILSGDLIGRSYAVDEMPFTIGRQAECAIVIPKKYFSRKHAEIVRSGAGFAIRGLSAKNPVLVNEAEVEESPLADGDQFEICGVKFRFRAEGRGQTKAERAIERASGVHVAVGSAVTERRSRDELVNDDALPGDEATEQRRAGVSDLDDGELPDDMSDAPPKKGTTFPDMDDGPLPGEDGSGDRFAFDPGNEKPKASKASRATVTEKPGSGFAAKESVRADGAPGWKPEAAGGPRERVVFGTEEPAAAKKSKASGPGAADEDKEERTDQIDISKLKQNADPFAKEAKKGATKDPAAIAARERFLKTLVGIGVFGIVLSLGLLWYMNRPKGPPPVFDHALEPACRLNETRTYTQLFSEDDPPTVNRFTPYSGEPVDLVTVTDPNVATVEWAVPEARGTAYFIVTGKAPGSTAFKVAMQSGVTHIYRITVVADESPHEVAKKKRVEALANMTEEALKASIDKRLSHAKNYRESAGKTERADLYVRKILHECELADEEVHALSDKINKAGIADPTLQDRCDAVATALQSAQMQWQEQRARTITRLSGAVRSHDYAQAATFLKALCSIWGDHCGADYQRYALLLEKIYQHAGVPGSQFEDPGCVETDSPP